MTDVHIIAGKMLKVLRLARMPGMDEIAIKLNCELTYDEEKEARLWSHAFEVAKKARPDDKLFDLTAKLTKDTA